MPSTGPTISAENAIISAGINSSMLTILLLGMYTIIFIGTFYIYISNRTSRSFLVLTAITMLYLLNVAQSVVQWILNADLLVLAGQPTGVIYVAAFSDPGWDILINNICTFMIPAFADGILIWRCYNVWNCSWRVVLVPLILLVAQLGFCISTVTINCMQKLNPSISTIRTINISIATGLFATAASTIITTVLITYRIYRVSHNKILGSSRNTYKNILDLLVQSAAVYCLFSLVYAIESVIPVTIKNQLTIICVTEYSGVLFYFMAGVAPTVMVARVALSSGKSPKREPTTRMSGLHFQGQDTSINTSLGSEEGMNGA